LNVEPGSNWSVIAWLRNGGSFGCGSEAAARISPVHGSSTTAIAFAADSESTASRSRWQTTLWMSLSMVSAIEWPLTGFLLDQPGMPIWRPRPSCSTVRQPCCPRSTESNWYSMPSTPTLSRSARPTSCAVGSPSG
jgi:hypothetical protein